MTIKNRKNVKEMDVKIAELVSKLGDVKLEPEARREIESQIEALVEYRTKLCGPASNHPILSSVITGAFGLAGIALVLYYEKTDIVTSKAFTIGTRMIGG